MHSWLNEIQLFLSELIRLDGRAEHQSQRYCSDCSKGEPLYRCQDCLGGSLVCKSCIVGYHAYNPFHHIEVRTLLSYLLSPFNQSRFGTVPSSTMLPSNHWAVESSLGTASARPVLYLQQRLVTHLL